MSTSHSRNVLKGRGTSSMIPGRFTSQTIEPDENIELDHDTNNEEMPRFQTAVHHENARTIISRNQSPDVPFGQSINPYRGCEHGCIYCFARPSHAYLDLSPGLDFETKLSAKINAAEVLQKELSHPDYQCQPIALGMNTDAYQPIEKDLKITRALLEVAYQYKQPISLITKSSLILRDIDLLAAMASERLLHVAISVTTLDNDLKRQLEPRATSGAARLKVIAALKENKIPVTALVAPVIPFVNDHELERIVAACAQAGADGLHYIMLRLPHEVAPLFEEWLRLYVPERADRVLNHIREMHRGKLYNSQFGQRMTGEGVYADLIHQRFHLARQKAGVGNQRLSTMDVSSFRVPPQSGDQIDLF